MVTDALFERYYYARPSFRPGTPLFHDMCRRHIPDRARVLEIGPGRSNSTTSFLSSFTTVIGVDISEEARLNSALSDSYIYDGKSLPFAGACFDACVSNYVAEHLTSPEEHLAEIARVLRPGGVYCLRTPNMRHYIPLISRCLPHRLHLRWANPMRRLEGDVADPFPTHYRLNTGRSLRNYSRRAGLEPIQITYVEAEPTYGRCHPLLFYPMMLYERLVNTSNLLETFRMNILAVLVRSD